MWPGDARAGLAVSGGPDSLALLLLAHEAFPGRFEVATVDHGLRPESAGEAAAVAKICAERGIAHATLRPEVAATGNLQANARAARYAALGEWAEARGLAAVVTAHHLDDQAETLLMRLNRGAGVRGLAAMRADAPLPGHPRLRLIRPLLGWRKAELEAIVAAAGLAPVSDPSNSDPRFDRARLRDAMASAPWLDPPSLAAAAAHCADADEALDWTAEQEWNTHVSHADAGLAYDPAAPRAIRLRVIERIVAQLGREGIPRGGEVARLLDTLERGGVATLAGVRADGMDRSWRFAPAPPRRS
ncbi:MAG TPA: tRNA lysidine(34) synthetase TilS [Novosphingobium sp.]|nr:tRNA lysidine(34) synthetase TilS [Novosphingobium sp.]